MATRSGREFEATTLPHLDAVYALARRLSGNGPEAEDLVQEVYLRALHGFQHFDLRSYGAKPWLFKILYNVYYSSETRRRRQPTLLDDVHLSGIGEELEAPELNGDGTSSIQWDRVDDELKAAVDRLPADYAVVLLMWGVEGLSYREIADACGCPIGTVMSRLFRARQMLIRDLASYAENRQGSRRCSA